MAVSKKKKKVLNISFDGWLRLSLIGLIFIILISLLSALVDKVSEAISWGLNKMGAETSPEDIRQTGYSLTGAAVGGLLVAFAFAAVAASPVVAVVAGLAGLIMLGVGAVNLIRYWSGKKEEQIRVM